MELNFSFEELQKQLSRVLTVVEEDQDVTTKEIFVSLKSRIELIKI